MQEDTSLSKQGAVSKESPAVPQNLRDRLGSYQPAKAPPLREAASLFVSPAETEISYLRPAGPEEERSNLVLEQQTNLPAFKDSDPVGQPHKADITTAEPIEATQATMHFGAEPYRLVGQLFDCYWVVQQGERVFFIDQHAAHEKVKYERLMKQFHEKSVVSQRLMPPIIVSLTGQEESVLHTYEDAFTQLGFEIEAFGGNEYALRSVPVDLYGCSERELFLAVLDELSQETGNRGSFQVIEEKIASMSCKAAVKGNNRLSLQEAEQLIDELLTLDNPYNCPHGRPTIITMTETDLEKKFKRIV